MTSPLASAGAYSQLMGDSNHGDSRASGYPGNHNNHGNGDTELATFSAPTATLSQPTAGYNGNAKAGGAPTAVAVQPQSFVNPQTGQVMQVMPHSTVTML